MPSAPANTRAEPLAEYHTRLSERRQTLSRAQQAHRRIGTARLLMALVAAAIFWLAFTARLPAFWLLVPAAAFIALVVVHSRVERERALAQRAVDYYTHALDRLADRWTGKGETGDRFRDPKHPYAEDLDLFGPASLFELLSTARTRGGESTLANWLLSPADRPEILMRQAAIDELRTRVDLREDLAILGQDFRAGVHPEELAAWGSAPAILFPQYLRVLAPILAVLAFALIVGFFITSFVNPAVRVALVLTAVFEGLLAFPFRARVAQIVSSVDQPGHDLSLLSQVLARLESERFVSPLLASLRAALDVEGRPASARIASLQRLIGLLDSRDHVVVRVFGPLIMWTTQLSVALESWRKSSGPFVPGWLAAVGQLEALSSLACYAFEHPADPFPLVPDGPPVFSGKALGHPLLPESQCVRNDLCLSPELRLIVLSGSNMSGKSTLLRTTGINAVMALAGAPVRAESMKLSPLHIGASIRINDSLQDGSSRFYAEITRLRDILQLCERGPVLFLLDELLNGTNSHDRQIGANAVVRGLLDRAAIGLITTHDLALAAIADSLSPEAANMHFEDHLENGVMTFDYTIRPGVVRKSNALELMRAVGLEV